MNSSHLFVYFDLQSTQWIIEQQAYMERAFNATKDCCVFELRSGALPGIFKNMLLTQRKLHRLSQAKDVRLIRQLRSNARPTFYKCTVLWTTTPTFRRRTQLPMPRFRLHCIQVYYRTGEVTGENLYCLRFALSSRQVQSACKKSTPM